MAATSTQSDALRIYRTVAEAGDPQPDPVESLGGARSSTVALRPGHLVSGAISNVRIDDLVGPLGEAVIRAIDSHRLRLTLPDQVEGQAVEMPPGIPRQVISGSSHAVLTRTSTAPLVGLMRVRIVPTLNNALSMPDLEDGDRQAGLTIHRAVMLHNGDPEEALQDVQVWFEENPGNVFALGLEAPDEDSRIQTIEDPTDVPSGVSFHAPNVPGEDLKINELAPMANHGLWIRRATPGEEAAAAINQVAINVRASAHIIE